MTKADWLDFFEAINGRSASEEEIAAALAAGEFQDDAPVATATEVVEETAVQETAEAVSPVQEATSAPSPAQEVPVQAQATAQTAQQAQTNPFANGQVVAGPGQQVQFINGQAVVVPAQPSAFATTFKNYWTWFLNAWKRPADMTSYGKHNGWLNYIFLSLLLTFANFFTLRAISGSITSAFSRLSSGYLNVPNSVGVAAFFAVLFASFLGVFAYILAIFVTRKAIYRDSEITFVNSFDRFGRMTSLALPILLATLFFALVGLVRIPLFLLAIVSSLFSLSNLFSINSQSSSWKADKFYQWILANLLNGAIVGILLTIAFMFVMPFIGQIFTSFYAELMNQLSNLAYNY